MDLERLCKEAVEIAKRAGAFIHQEAANFDLSKIEHKGANNDLVSYVDKEAEKILVEGLRKILPEAAFVTEENTVITEAKKLRWVIDPLDGTTNFLHGFPIFSISIGLIDGDEVLVGIVYELNKDECFYAWQNGGAWCNGRPIKISSVSHLKDALLVTGFPYNLEDKADAFFDIIKHFVSTTHGVRRIGSAAVDFAYVACGRLEGYFEYNLKPWDVAGGILLVQEAGGKVTDFKGGKGHLEGKEIAAAGKVHSEMLQEIQKFWN